MARKGGGRKAISMAFFFESISALVNGVPGGRDSRSDPAAHHSALQRSRPKVRPVLPGMAQISPVSIFDPDTRQDNIKSTRNQDDEVIASKVKRPPQASYTQDVPRNVSRT